MAMRSSLALMAMSITAATAAHAQSTVGIGGALDLAARSVSNTGGGSLQSLSPSGNTAARLAFFGFEDLGGGLRAGFHLESDVNADVGMPGATFWGRRSTVSLLSDRWGEMRLGRDYTPTFSNQVAYDPFSNVGLGSALNVTHLTVATQPTFVRASNSVAYWLPAGPFYGRVQFSAAEGAANTRYAGFNAGYLAGSVRISVAAGRQQLAIGRFETVSLGGSYDFGSVKLLALHSIDKVAAFKESRSFVAATFNVGNDVVKAQIGKANVANSPDDALLLALGYVHNLSKRTALYGTVARISNKGGRQQSLPSGAALEAGGRSSGCEFGLRHNF